MQTINRIAPYLTIDADSHVGMDPNLWDRYLDQEFRKNPDRPRFEEIDGVKYFRAGRYWYPHLGRHPYLSPSGQPPGPIGGVDPHFRMKDFMNPEGIDRGLLMPSRIIGPSYMDSREMGNAMAQAYNNWLQDFCKTYPDRYFGFGVINAGDPAAAIKEMHRCLFELGFPAIYINPQVIGNGPGEYHTLASEHYFPIYEEASRLNVPLAIHAFSDPYVPGHEYNWPKGPGLWSDIIGFPMTGMQAFCNLVLGGVCELFPKLKLGIFEAGLGWVPMVIERIHERKEKFVDSVRIRAPLLKLNPEEYVQRQLWLGFEPEDHFLPLFIEWTKAPNRTLFSADHPHLDYQPGQTREFMERTDVSPEHIRMALRDNALEFCRWDVTVAPTDKMAEAVPAE